MRSIAIAAAVGAAACGPPAAAPTGAAPGPRAVAPAAPAPSPASPSPSPSPAPAAAAPDATARTLLDEHNRYRARHCAPALTWDREIAAAAQAWADELARGCTFEHSRTRYGENLAAGTAGWLTPEEVVAMWYREVERYDFARGAFSADTGHFTQLAWKDSLRLGCGVARCGELDLYVCQYDPPGNVRGAFTRQVLPATCR